MSGLWALVRALDRNPLCFLEKGVALLSGPGPGDDWRTGNVQVFGDGVPRLEHSTVSVLL